MNCDLRVEIDGLHRDIRAIERRLSDHIGSMAEELCSRFRALIVGWLLINIVAEAGALYGFAKLLGH
jgi:hypothetical protein